jgi:hypothetical protein
MIPNCRMLKINFIFIPRDLESIIGDTIVESLIAIESKKITSNCYKNLETMVINLWDM